MQNGWLRDTIGNRRSAVVAGEGHCGNSGFCGRSTGGWRMGQQWYWMQGEQKLGPIETAGLKELVRNGQLRPTDLIWREGLPNWVHASQARGLFPDRSPVAAARPARTRTSPQPVLPAETVPPPLPPALTQPVGGRRIRRVWVVWALGGGLAAVCAVVALGVLLMSRGGGPSEKDIENAVRGFYTPEGRNWAHHMDMGAPIIAGVHIVQPGVRRVGKSWVVRVRVTGTDRMWGQREPFVTEHDYRIEFIETEGGWVVKERFVRL